MIFNPTLENWTFDELPKFRMALTPTLLSELDELKLRPHLREKAERAIRHNRGYRNRGRLRDGVPLRKGVSTVFSVAKEPRIDPALTWLDPASADDRLIASALDLARRSVRVPVIIATRDINLENKADFIGMPTVQPPEPPHADEGA
jgi:predicted ribonuclease YlaK